MKFDCFIFIYSSDRLFLFLENIGVGCGLHDPDRKLLSSRPLARCIIRLQNKKALPIQCRYLALANSQPKFTKDKQIFRNHHHFYHNDRMLYAEDL